MHISFSSFFFLVLCEITLLCKAHTITQYQMEVICSVVIFFFLLHFIWNKKQNKALRNEKKRLQMHAYYRQQKKKIDETREKITTEITFFAYFFSLLLFNSICSLLNALTRNRYKIMCTKINFFLLHFLLNCAQSVHYSYVRAENFHLKCYFASGKTQRK